MIYKLATNSLSNTQMLIKNNELWIPADENNSDYQEYLAWLESGNIPEVWEEQNAVE
jgi:hypothetical protein